MLLMVVVKLQSIQFFAAPPKEIRSRKKQRRFIRCGIAEASGEPAPLGQKTKYNDGPFEKVFMTLFARKMEKFANAKEQRKEKVGLWDFLYDYERFVDVSKRVMQGKNRMQQQLIVREVLLSMLPPGAPAQVSLSCKIKLFHVVVLLVTVMHICLLCQYEHSSTKIKLLLSNLRLDI